MQHVTEAEGEGVTKDLQDQWSFPWEEIIVFGS